MKIIYTLIGLPNKSGSLDKLLITENGPKRMNYKITSQTFRGNQKGYAFKSFTHDVSISFCTPGYRAGEASLSRVAHTQSPVNSGPS